MNFRINIITHVWLFRISRIFKLETRLIKYLTNVYTKTANTNINRIAFVFSLLHANVAFTRVIRLPIGTSVTGNLPHHVKKNGNETILEEEIQWKEVFVQRILELCYILSQKLIQAWSKLDLFSSNGLWITVKITIRYDGKNLEARPHSRVYWRGRIDEDLLKSYHKYGRKEVLVGRSEIGSMYNNDFYDEIYEMENRIVTSGTSRGHKYFLLRIPSCYPGLYLPPLFFTQQLYNGEQKLNSIYNNKYNTVQYRSFSCKRLLVYPFLPFLFYTYRYFPFLL